MPIIIKYYKASLFAVFINDYSGAGNNFNALFDFLYTIYFSKIAFNLVYLAEYKTFVFINNLLMLKFKKNKKKIRLLIKYRAKILNWPIL